MLIFNFLLCQTAMKFGRRCLRAELFITRGFKFCNASFHNHLVGNKDNLCLLALDLDCNQFIIILFVTRVEGWVANCNWCNSSNIIIHGLLVELTWSILYIVNSEWSRVGWLVHDDMYIFSLKTSCYFSSNEFGILIISSCKLTGCF